MTPALSPSPLPPGAARAVIGERTAHFAAERWERRLRAVVLTGSLARDEATFRREGNQVAMWGDADILLVFRERCRLPDTQEIHRVAAAIEDALAGWGISAKIGLAAVRPGYLRRLPCHIAAYELRECGRVIWGDESVLDLAPRFPAAAIDREDAWRMLANRVIELLECVAAEEANSSPGDRTHYAAVKLQLDMATSYLVFAGAYEPTYRARARRLSELAGGLAPWPRPRFSMREFSARVWDCTRFKLGETGRLEIDRERAVRAAAVFAHALWNWELGALANARQQEGSRELMRRWMARQPLGQRLRGWASVWRRSRWTDCAEWPRWARLARCASPRYWIYSVASELLAELAAAPAGNWADLFHRLPLAGAEGPSWYGLARQTALNYHRFLETTLT